MKNLPLSTIRDKAGALSATQGFGFIGKLLDIYDDISKKSTEKKDEIIFARAESIITRAIELGKQGRLKIAPEHISVSATANCNLKCVMCPGHAGKSGPKLSIDEAEMLFVTLADEDIDFGQPKTLDMTNGEPTLNRDLVAIYQRFKELFPRAKISMISNATIPVKGRFRKAYELSDIIGLSMDGATAETYERIRKGSVYRNVVRNVKDIAKIKKQGVNCDSLQLMFVAMDQNIHELPEMVRLTHSVGISELFVQESEVRGGSPFNTEGQNITLGLPENELASIVNEAKSEASRLGIRLSLTPPFEKALLSKQPAKNRTEEKKRKPPQAKLDVAIKTCAYPWLFSPRIIQDTENGIHAGTVCCHMPNQSQRVSLKNRPDMKDKSIVDMFNSEFYWDIRSGLLDGTLANDACKGCQYFNVTQWNAAQLRQLETVVDALDS